MSNLNSGTCTASVCRVIEEFGAHRCWINILNYVLHICNVIMLQENVRVHKCQIRILNLVQHPCIMVQKNVGAHRC